MKKLRKTRWMAGMLAFVLTATTFFNAGSTVLAASEQTDQETETVVITEGVAEVDLETEEATAVPKLAEVIALLAEDEIVTARDYSMIQGESFEPDSDFTNLDINPEKVKVTLKEITDEQGNGFDVNQPGNYQAVYLCEPISSNPAYLINRQVIVTEKETDTQGSENNSRESKDDSETDEEEGESESQADAETFLLTTLPFASITGRSTRTSVGLVIGKSVYYPSNLGNYSTHYYYVDGHIAYCLESNKNSPATGAYIAEVLQSNENLQKVLYYGFGGPGDITGIYMPQFDDDLKYVFTHIAASYAYVGLSGFYGCTMQDLEDCGVLGYIDYLFGLEAPPSASLSLSADSLAAYMEGDVQRTSAITLQGDQRNTITIGLPADVTFHSGNTTQTGGNVSVSVGTSFYFTAPKTRTGTWSTGSMSGTIGSQWSCLVVETGSSQDIGYGTYTEIAAPVSFSIKWMDIAKIELVKQDAVTSTRLAGAVFGVYSDAACTKLIEKMPVTDANGASSLEIVKTQDTVYLKEITAPTGYKVNATAYNVKLVAGETTGVTATNEEQKGKITILKNGGILTGIKEGNPIQFIYGSGTFAGAKYELYAAEDIYSQDQRTKIYASGDLIQKLTTGSDGKVVSQELYLGKYKVVETLAPDSLTIGKTEEERTHLVTLSYKGQNVLLSETQTDYTNDRPGVSVSVVKESANEPDLTLEGAAFVLYAGEDIKNNSGDVVVKKNTIIETVRSNTNGKAAFTADIPIGYTYYIKEETAPDGYYKNDQVFTFHYVYKDDHTYTYTFENTFENEEVRGNIHVMKIDRETGTYLAQGDADLNGAVYGLYAREDIVHPNKKTGVLYQKGEIVAQATIKDGTLDFNNQYLGSYYVQEISEAPGYVLDTTRYPVNLTYEGQEVKIVKREVTIQEQVKKQAFQIIKISEDGEQTNVDLVEGAGFKIYLISSLKGVQDGSLQPSGGTEFAAEDFIGYDFSGEETAVLYENKVAVPIPELFSDETGYVLSPEIPYGRYVVVESTTPENLDTVAPFIVNVGEDSREPKVWTILDDRPFQFLFKIIKKDAQTGKPILGNSAYYKIYDMDDESYVEQIVRYPKYEKINVFQTNEEGYLITPEQLKSGRYRIEEVQAPENYVKPGYEQSLLADGVEVPTNVISLTGSYLAAPTEAILVNVSANTVHEVESETNKKIIVVEQYNEEAVGSLTLTKTGEHLTGTLKPKNSLFANIVNALSGSTVDKEALEPAGAVTFTYEEGAVEGAEFALYAADTIYTTDGQTDEEGNRLVRYEKDALVATIKTDSEGKAVVNNLPIGKYYVKETLAGKSFVLNTKTKEFEITYDGDETAVIYESVSYYNERQKVLVSLLKKDSETKKPVEGALFGLYAGEDILDANGTVVISKDELVEQGQTLTDGTLVFTVDLPHGSYYVKEDAPAEGYLQNDKVYSVDAAYKNQDVAVIEVSYEIENQPTVVEISKTDLTTGENVQGAKLQILDADNQVVKEWITGEGPCIIYALAPGEYTLHEEIVEKGYLFAEDVTFTVEATGEIQKVEMKDARAQGKLIIHKTDADTKLGIESVEFTLTNKETGEVVATLVTDADGMVESGLLDIGTFKDGKFETETVYLLKETKAKDRYILNGEEQEFVFEYQDGNMPVIEITKEITNQKQEVEKTTAPKTGDDTNVMVLVGIAVISLMVIAVYIWKRKKAIK